MNTASNHSAPLSKASRRTVLASVAWAAPAAVVATSAPAIASSREFTLSSNFGVGWYPDRVGSTSSGRIQMDTSGPDKNFYVTGTRLGDTITDVRLEWYVERKSGSSRLHPVAYPGSNSRWSTPSYSTSRTVDEVTYDVFTSSLTGTVGGIEGRTDIPIGFYFYAPTPYYNNWYARVYRFATVVASSTSFPVTAGGTMSRVINRNVKDWPTP